MHLFNLSAINRPSFFILCSLILTSARSIYWFIKSIILYWLYQEIPYFFDFIQKEDLFCWICDGPEFQDETNALVCHRLILLKVGYDTLHELLMNRLNIVWLVKLDQTLLVDGSMLTLQRHLEPLNDGANDFQELWMPKVVLLIVID